MNIGFFACIAFIEPHSQHSTSSCTIKNPHELILISMGPKGSIQIHLADCLLPTSLGDKQRQAGMHECNGYSLQIKWCSSTGVCTPIHTDNRRPLPPPLLYNQWVDWSTYEKRPVYKQWKPPCRASQSPNEYYELWILGKWGGDSALNGDWRVK